MDVGGFRSQLSPDLTLTTDTHITERHGDQRLALNQNKDGLVPTKNSVGSLARVILRDAGIISA